MSSKKCLIWQIGQTDLVEHHVGGHIVTTYDSPRAGGKYFVRCKTRNELYEFSDEIENSNNEIKARLTTILIDKRRSGEECTELTKEMFEDAKNKPKLSIMERADRLLQYFEQQTPQTEENINITGIESEGLAWSESIDVSEFYTLCEFLKDQDWLECTQGSDSEYIPKKILPKGLIHLEELRNINADSS